MPDLTPELYKKRYLHQDLTDKILKVFYYVYNSLGYGFLEKVYQNAMLLELALNGIECEAQRPISVFYRGEIIGEYFADIIVDDTIILELKAVSSLTAEHEAQLINYLRSTKMEVGLLLNFGVKPEVHRKIFTNDRKKFNE